MDFHTQEMQEPWPKRVPTTQLVSLHDEDCEERIRTIEGVEEGRTVLGRYPAVSIDPRGG